MPEPSTHSPDFTPQSFDQVLIDELRAIEESRKLRERPPAGPSQWSGYRQADHVRALGVAFSGGGIRSATFNLGVLQALARLKLLERVDYLSTVSGGGYIGTWLNAWIFRRDQALREPPTQGSGAPASGSTCGLLEVQKVLAGEDGTGERGSDTKPTSAQPKGTTDRSGENGPHEIHWLREFSNYLTPRRGLFGADTWAAMTTYTRNLLLNFLIVVLAILALLIVPHVLDEWYMRLATLSAPEDIAKVLAPILVLLLGAVTVIAFNFRIALEQAAPDTKSLPQQEPWFIYALAIVPLVAGSWLLSVVLWWLGTRGFIDRGPWIVGAIVANAGIWAYAWLLGKLLLKEKAVHDREVNTAKAFLATVMAGAVSGAVGGLLLNAIARWMASPTSVRDATAAVAVPDKATVVLAMPLVALAIGLTEVLHLGLIGRRFPEELREWWSRAGGAVMKWTLVITAVTAVTLFGLDVIVEIEERAPDWINEALTSGWLITTITGVLAGKSAASSGGSPNRVVELVTKVAPAVFIIGLILLLAVLLERLLPVIEGWDPGVGQVTWLLIVALLMLLAAWFLSWRVDVNEFSMHALYRNRLVRCYLGASNSKRNAHPFTGFDPSDDSLKLHELRPDCGTPFSGPYPIINTALNLVSGDNLAWQQRKATSFAFTPQYSGYEIPLAQRDKRRSGQLHDKGFRRSEAYGNGISLGTAVAISGAAASPNMGYHTSKAVAFLMTVFNVRLGWWLANSRHRALDGGRSRGRGVAGPRAGLFYLLAELMGQTNDRRKYVYLSDGGHFENLGLYELVRRRCRFIIVCDAAEDRAMKFTSLGNAIEKCRTDFGVDIELDVTALHLDSQTKTSRRHCAIGKIHYPPAAEGDVGPVGTVVYIRSTLTGDEPTDINRYAAHHPEFPHQSTADQWFDESQFESYRALGEHIGHTVFGVLGNRAEIERSDTEDLFIDLRQRWYPPSKAVAETFTKHTGRLSHVLEAIRGSRDLDFLDAQLYPEWLGLAAYRGSSPAAQAWLPERHSEMRDGFYVCTQMIQLMQDVYIDLELESEYGHPDNRGWMNLFRRCSESGMFRVAWAIGASTYGARFQNFCERRLDLSVGTIEYEELAASGDESPDKSLEAAKRQGIIDHQEERLLRGMVQSGFVGDGSIFALQIGVSDPTEGHASDARTFRFTFAVGVRRGEELAFYRVRRSLRQMRLGRSGLEKLVDDEGVTRPAEVTDLPRVSKTAAQAFRKLFWSVASGMERRKGEREHHTY
ncbi:MAG: hypothetical protein HKM89_05595 [Gemmatimonadales bacterium]|nr:hypothetical protein [Gemmatimonadales bacterium]